MNDHASAPSHVRAFLARHPHVRTLEVVLTDLNGIYRGKWIPANTVDKVLGGDLKISLTAVSADIWGRDVPSLCQKTGDGDGFCTPIESSIRLLPWRDQPTALCSCSSTRRMASPGAMTRANRHCQLGGQLYSTEVMQDQAGLLHEMREACESMNVPLDGLVKELAASQYELNLHYLPDPLEAADNDQLLKQVIKSVARKHGYIATFMAKPFGDRDGNGFHTHVSLLDRDGQIVFDDGTHRGSDRLRHAIGGLARTMPDCMLIFAPHHNSYRRLWRGVHGPLAPTWGYENRYVAMRVPNGAGAARRVEHRIAGADANPYLSLAAILAGILHGLEHGIEPEAPIAGGPSAADPALPGNWFEALLEFERSQFVAEALGADFREAFAAVKRMEQNEFTGAVNPLEYNTYLVLA